IIHLTPSDGHGTIAPQIKIIFTFPEPSFYHSAVGVKVIPLASVIDPACSHQSVGVKVIPLPINLFPAKTHCTGGKIHVVVTIGSLDPAFAKRAAILHIGPAV